MASVTLTGAFFVAAAVTKFILKNYIIIIVKEDIVERRDFDSVQKALSLDTRRSPGDSAVQLFSGMVFCGECGASMVRKTVPSGIKSMFTTSAPRTSRINPVRPIGCAMKRWNSWFWTR